MKTRDEWYEEMLIPQISKVALRKRHPTPEIKYESLADALLDGFLWPIKGFDLWHGVYVAAIRFLQHKDVERLKSEQTELLKKNLLEK